MKLHLPLSLRSALFVAVAALSSYPFAQAEEVSISSDTLYQYGSTVFFRGSASYVGVGNTPTYTLTFEGTTDEVNSNTLAFALVGDELSFSNMKTLEFKHHRFRSTWYEWGGGVLGGSGSTYNLWGGSVINAGMADSIREEANSPQACVVNITGNGNVLFRDNKSYNGGGAVAIKNTELTIQDNKSITFEGNVGGGSGGAINALNSGVHFKNNDSVVFESNTANSNGSGGALNVEGGPSYTSEAPLLFEGNKSIVFSSNIASWGGAIHLGGGSSTRHLFQNNVGDDSTKASILFEGNKSIHHGGAIYTEGNLSFLNNGHIEFIDNENSTHLYGGGAVLISSNCDLTFDGNDGLRFTGNKTAYNGGAIYCGRSFSITNTKGTVLFEKNESVSTVSGSGNGGAIYSSATGAYISISDNKANVIFKDNHSTGSGGAIYADGSRDVYLDNNQTLSFVNNSSDYDGGAMYHWNTGNSYEGCSISGNAHLNFEGNTAAKGGGALYFGSKSRLLNNGTVTFKNNVAQSGGGAISTPADLRIEGNGSVSFTGNNALYGGAIYQRIYALSICGNTGDVTFRDNYERRYNADNELESIVLNAVRFGRNDNAKTFAANEGQTITFADAIYQEHASYAYTYLNKYTPYGESEEVTTQGNIVLTGKDARTRLAKLWTDNGLTPEGDAFEAALTESVTFDLNSTYLYGGTLSVEDGAHVQFQAFYAKDGSTLHLKNSTASCLYGQSGHHPYPTFESGATLEVEKSVVVEIDTYHDAVLMQDASEMKFRNAELTVNGTMKIGESAEDAVTAYLSGYEVGEHTVLKASTALTQTGQLSFEYAGEWAKDDGRMYYLVGTDATSITAKVAEGSATLQWTAGNDTWENAEWTMCDTGVEVAEGETLLIDEKHYFDRDHVVFDQGGRVNISGTVSPASILVAGTDDVTLHGDGTIAGEGALIKRGTGTLTLATANTYSGGTTIEEGSLVVESASALGNGDVAMAGGSLLLMTDSSIAASFTLSGGTLEYDSESIILQIGGTFEIADKATILLRGSYEEDVEYTLLTAGELSGSLGNLTFASVNDRYHFSSKWVNQSLVVTVRQNAAELFWLNAKKAVWQQGEGGWMNAEGEDSVFAHGDDVTIGDGTVSIVGAVQPGKMTLNPTKSLTFKTKRDKKSGEWSGVIEGDTDVTIAAGPKGKVTLNDGNTYTGTTTIESGTVNVGGADSFGESVVTISGGTLDLKGKAVANSITLTGEAAIKGGKKYAGEFEMTNGELQKGSVLDIKEKATLAGGTVNGAISGTGTVYVTGGQFNTVDADIDNEVTLGANGKLSCDNLHITGVLKVGSKGLAMNAKASDIVITGASQDDSTWMTGALVSEGKVSANSLTMNGGVFDMNNAKPMGLTLKGDACLSSGATVQMYGAFSAQGLTLTQANFFSTMDEVYITSKNQPKMQNFTLTGKGSDNTWSQSFVGVEGNMTVAGNLSLSSSMLSMYGSKPVGLTVKGDLSIDGIYKEDMPSLLVRGKLSASSLTLESGQLYVVHEKLQTVTLSGKNASNRITSDSEAYFTANVNVTGNLEVQDSMVYIFDQSKKKGANVTIKGILDVSAKEFEDDDKADFYMSGSLKAAQLNVSNVHFQLKNDDKLQSATLSGKGTNTMTHSQVYMSANTSVNGNLTLDNSILAIWDASSKKAASLSVKGDMQMNNSSTLSITGALSATNLTLNSGTINVMSYLEPKAIKVSQTLTIGESFTLELLERTNIKVGKVYNLFTFKTLIADTSDLYELLGMEDARDYCTLDVTAKAITLSVSSEQWLKWREDHTYQQVAVSADEPGITTCAALADEGEAVATAAEEESEEANPEPAVTTLPVQQGADVAELIAKVSDTLVQTTWGTAKASRAFVDSIGNRGQNATALAEGRGAAWGGVIGATSRLSSHGGSLGADHTLSGAVFGAEMNATPHHSIGMAMGVTWGEINTLSAYNVDQDSTHLAAYGQSRLGKSLTLDWSAAYGRSENDADILGRSYDWTQHALQLDARLSYAYALNERTTLRGFGGMQYLHIDSDTPEKGLKADSMQNVRVELGVGATYMATDKTAIYGEVSFIGDIVRDNPATHIGGNCRGGSNPGRAGMNMTVGATHALNDNWSLNASYNMELQPRANAHNATVGATYRF